MEMRYRYCFRGHWIKVTRATREQDWPQCHVCKVEYLRNGKWPPIEWWDEATLDPDSELAADLARVRAVLSGFSTLERLRVGLWMQGRPTPFPGGRRWQT
jgi:hypothetical protein